MTTIIRVKRHRQDDPVEAVLLSFKRRRTEEAGDLPGFEKVLNFYGTVEKKDDLVAQRTVASFVDQIKEKGNIKNHQSDILSKIRKENKTRIEKNRLKVVSCLRSTSETEELGSVSEKTGKNVAIVDVNLEKKDESSDDLFSSDDPYVYDIYSANFGNDEFNDIFLDNVVGVEPYTSQSQAFDLQYRDPEDYADEYIDPDEDDSNDENNWRNTYPDSDHSSDSDERELTSQWGRLTLDDGDELSSDDGEEDYPNYTDSKDMKNYHFYEAESLGGRKYAKYKMNILKSLDCNNVMEENEECEENF